MTKKTTKSLDYAIAHTDADEMYVIIPAQKTRHPIANLKLSKAVISWVNAQGETELIGDEVPLPQELLSQARKHRLFISELDTKTDTLGVNVLTLTPQHCNE